MTAGTPSGDDYTFPAVRTSPAYTSDGTVFATFENRTLSQAALYKSTDRGATWTISSGVGGGRALGVSPAYASDRTVFFGRGDRVFKSTDGGATWTSYPIAPTGGRLLRLRAGGLAGIRIRPHLVRHRLRPHPTQHRWRTHLGRR